MQLVIRHTNLFTNFLYLTYFSNRWQKQSLLLMVVSSEKKLTARNFLKIILILNYKTKENGKKVLTLTVSKQWFDMIVACEKTEEYREIKPYWVARLFQNNSNIVNVRNLSLALAGRTDLLKKYIDAQRIVLKQYTHVLFINGYRKDSPRIEKKIESIAIGKPKKGLCPDKWLDTEFFVIKFK